MREFSAELMNNEAYQSIFAKELAGEGSDGSFQKRLENALKSLKLVKADETLLDFQEIYGWKKGGDETYIAAARLEISDGQSRTKRAFISKAIVSFQIDERIKSMMKRRQHLEQIGILTPEVFSIYSGCINQAFIPLSCDDALKNPTLERLKQLARIAAKLDLAGYTTLNFVRDLRSDELNWFYVDFGFDLGEPGQDRSDTAFVTLQKLISRNLHLKRFEEVIKREYFSLKSEKESSAFY